MSEQDNEAAGGEETASLSEQVEVAEPEEQVEATEQGGEAETEAAEDAEDDGDTAEEIAEARRMGWTPESEWKGGRKPARFKTAREFIEDGKAIDKFVNKRLETELADVKAQLAGMAKASEVALKRQREKLEADFEARMERAVEMGDTEAYREAKKEKAEALKDLDDQAESEEPKEEGMKPDPNGALKTPAEVSSFKDWHAENTWFCTDKKLTALMNAEFEEVSAEMTAADVRTRLEEAKRRVAEVFPDKFGKTKTPRAGAVESGSRMAGGGGKQRLADKLPDEARKAADKYIAEGLFKDREEYAKEYFGNEAA